MNHQYIVIMAGGSGTRLWPLSRKNNPKQFKNLLHKEKTLLQETYERITPLTKNISHIFISTTKEYAPLVHKQLPNIKKENVIIEPCGRDTAPAIALVAHTIFKKDPQAIITTTPSDHAIKNPSVYISTVKTAFSVIEKNPEKFGLIGITPTEPSTELGYIKIGKELSGNFKKQVFEAAAFKEKPTRSIAQKYISQWSYLWNAAYFVFCAKSFLTMTQKYAPHIIDTIKKLDTVTNIKKKESIFCKLPKEAIDTTILEKLPATHRFVIPANLEWSDVGNWRTLHDFHQTQKKSSTNILRGDIVDTQSENCMIFSDGKKTIATLGLTDVIVVDTDDVTLITHRDHAHNVKHIIEKLKKNRKNLL